MKNRFLHIGFWVLIFGFFQNQISFAQNVTVAAKLDSARFLIGDHVAVHFEINNPNHLPTQWTELNFDTASHFELIGAAKIDTNKNGFSQTVFYTNFDSGHYTIPAFTFLVKQNNKVDTLQTQPLSIYLKGIPVDTLKAIRPIKNLMQIPYTFKEILPYLLIGETETS